MTPAIEKFKRQFIGWCKYHDLGPGEHLWIEPEDVHGLENAPWVAAALCIDGHELSAILNGYGDWRLQASLERLLTACGVWWDTVDSCLVWIYEPSVLDAFIESEKQNADQV